MSLLVKGVVTSTALVKVESARQELRYSPEELIGVKAQSNVNEQPVGAETQRGSRNRIAHAKTLVPKELLGKVFFLSFENGIFAVARGWEDRCIATLERPDGAIFDAVSTGVVFPMSAVQETASLPGGFMAHTVGSVIAKRYAEEGVVCDPQDPHAVLTAGQFTRTQQITEVLRKVWKKAYLL